MALGCMACDRRYSIGLNGLNGLGDDFSVNDSGDPIDVTLTDSGWTNPFPPSVGTNLPSYVGPTNSINWNNLANIFSQTGAKIALAATGSNPSYQTTGPGGSTTVYGTPSSAITIPSLTSGLGIGTIAMLGIGAVILMMAMKK